MVKMVIVCRSDLKLRKGQLMAQAAHASMIWLTKMLRYGMPKDSDIYRAVTVEFTEEEKEWITGPFTKIVLSVDSRDNLETIEAIAIEAGLICNRVEESTLGGEVTCIGIGPHDAEKIDPITRHLKPFS